MLRVNHLAGFGKKRPASGGGGGGVDPNPKSLVFACGFECGQLGSAGQHWITATGVSIDTGTVRSGSRSMRLNFSASAATTAPNGGAPLGSSVAVMRYYIRFATLPGGDALLTYTSNASGDSIGLGFKSSDSTLRPLRRAVGGTLTFGSSGAVITTGQWYCVDMRLNYNGTNEVIDVAVDETALTQLSVASAGSMSTTIRVGTRLSATTDYYIDDFALSTTSGDFPLGPGHVHHFIPTSDGTHNTGTAGNFIVGSAGANITDATTDSYQYIDDVPLDDTTPDTNDYINLAANTGATSNYVEHVIGPASGISTPTLGPRGVEVIYAYHAASTGTGAHILKINDNGTEDTVQSFNAAGATPITYFRKHYVDPPSAATAWTTATGNGNFNNLRTRFGYSNDGNPDQYLDCVMIEAEFSE